MKKFWGWVLFLVALLDAGIIWYNLAIAPWRYEINDCVVIPYVVVLLLCLFGWYRLVIRKAVKEANNARR